MTKSITATALACALASPAFAQSYDPDVGSGNVALPSGYARASVEHVSNGRRLYLSSPHPFARAERKTMTFNAAPGGDPDPNIRFQLRRESEQGEW